MGKVKSKIFFVVSIMIISVLIVVSSLVSFGANNKTIYNADYIDAGTMADTVIDVIQTIPNVAQNHARHLTVDSPGYTPEPSFIPGATIDTGIKYDSTPTINGENVNQFTITVSTSEHMNTNMAAANMAEKFGYDDSECKNLITSYTPYGYPYGHYARTGAEYTITATISADGKLSFKVPSNFPNGVFAITAVTINGQTTTLEKTQRVYVRNGEVVDDFSAYDYLDNPSDPGNGPTTPDEQDDGYRWYRIVKTPTNYSHTEPSRSASISNSQYDVSTSIPTSENLSFSATADDSLYNITQRQYVASAGVNDVTLKVYAEYYVSCSHEITKIVNDYVTKTVNGKKVTVKVGSHKEVVGHEHDHDAVTISKEEKFSYSSTPLTFYDVPTSNITPVTSATISGAPVDGAVVIGLKGGPTVGAQTIRVAGTLPGVRKTEVRHAGVFGWNKAAAESALDSGINSLKNFVKSSVDGSITQTGNCDYSYRELNVTTTSSNGVTPEIKQTSGGTTKMIPSTRNNGLYETSGSVSYGGLVFGMSVNDVFVHTPVVNNASITNVQKFVNQKINVDSSRVYLQLDKSFTITIPRSGTHISAKGYGTRAYNSYQAVPKTITNWGKIKDVKLPFDAYLHEGNARTIIKAGHWLSEYNKATTDGVYTFTIPVWAKEGTGTIETRVVAENGSVNSPSQEGANLDSNNYIATKNINVEVIGKIYDLRISSTNDPGWQNIKGKNGNYVSASEFAFGQLGQNAVTNYKYAPKLGYTITFDFKTKGIKSNNVDVSIQPEGFYFVGKNGGSAEKVDLFYNTTSKKYIKITTGDNTNVPVITNLTSPFMKVSKQELIDSTRIMKTKLGVTYNYASNVNIGYFPRLRMPENLRLCYNNFAEYIGNGLYKKTETAIIQDATNGFVYNNRWGVLKDSANGKDVVIGAVGHWYAGYKLPASTVAAPSGTTSDALVKNPNLAKKDGYILVKFNIRTDYNEYEYLEYKGPESLNEGTIEKDKNGTTLNWPPKGTTTLTPSHNITLPNGKTATVPIGVVGIFETDFRSSNDYETEGTH